VAIIKGDYKENKKAYYEKGFICIQLLVRELFGNKEDNNDYLSLNLNDGFDRNFGSSSSKLW